MISLFNRMTVRGIEKLLSHCAGFSAVVSDDSGALFSGEAAADLNVVLIGADENAETFWTSSIKEAQRRGIPFIAMFTPPVSQKLAPIAKANGLKSAGKMPMMMLKKQPAPAVNGKCRIEEVRSESLAKVAGNILSETFELPRESVSRTFERNAHNEAVDMYLAFFEDEPVCTLTLIQFGQFAGIWAMATAKKFQRMGIGASVLNDLIVQYRRKGVEEFFLSASQPGIPLYKSSGFETIAQYDLWILKSPSELINLRP